MTGPISLSLAFRVFSATAGRLMDVSSEFTWLGPIPACNIPISGQQFCRLQETFTQFKTGYIFHFYSPAASFVFMSNTGLPRVPAFARCILLVWHTFISPQVSSPQVMYKKLPKPEIVSCVQSARRSGFPHDLQPPSSSFANNYTSAGYRIFTLRQRNAFNDFITFAQLSFTSFPQISTSLFEPCLSETPIFLAC